MSSQWLIPLVPHGIPHMAHPVNLNCQICHLIIFVFLTGKLFHILISFTSEPTPVKLCPYSISYLYTYCTSFLLVIVQFLHTLSIYLFFNLFIYLWDIPLLKYIYYTAICFFFFTSQCVIRLYIILLLVFFFFLLLNCLHLSVPVAVLFLVILYLFVSFIYLFVYFCFGLVYYFVYSFFQFCSLCVSFYLSISVLFFDLWYNCFSYTALCCLCILFWFLSFFVLLIFFDLQHSFIHSHWLHALVSMTAILFLSQTSLKRTRVSGLFTVA